MLRLQEIESLGFWSLLFFLMNHEDSCKLTETRVLQGCDHCQLTVVPFPGSLGSWGCLRGVTHTPPGGGEGITGSCFARGLPLAPSLVGPSEGRGQLRRGSRDAVGAQRPRRPSSGGPVTTAASNINPLSPRKQRGLGLYPHWCEGIVVHNQAEVDVLETGFARGPGDLDSSPLRFGALALAGSPALGFCGGQWLWNLFSWTSVRTKDFIENR